MYQAWPEGSIAQRKPHAALRHHTHIQPDVVLVQRADVNILNHLTGRQGLRKHPVLEDLNGVVIAIGCYAATCSQYGERRQALKRKPESVKLGQDYPAISSLRRNLIVHHIRMPAVSNLYAQRAAQAREFIGP